MASMYQRFEKDLDCNECKEKRREEKNKKRVSTKGKLLKDFPHILEQIDTNKHKIEDIINTPAGTKRRFNFKCVSGHTYETSLNSKIRDNTGCKQCYNIRQRKTNYDAKQNIIDNRNEENIKNHIIRLNNCVKIEMFFNNFIKKLDIVENVIDIGNYNAKADSIIELKNGMKKQVQYKKLSEYTKNTSYYYLNIRNMKYDDNMLILATNQDNNIFIIGYYKDIKNKYISIIPNVINEKYKEYVFYNENDLSNKFIEVIENSTDFEDMEKIMPPTNYKEYQMTERFIKKCLEYNLQFNKNVSNFDAIDGKINDKNIQLKFSSIIGSKGGYTYYIHSMKCAGHTGKIQTYVPYDEDDKIDLIIVEIDNKKNKYLNNFCIIPKEELIKQKIIKTSNEEGKKQFCICIPEYEKSHWSKKYWNRFDLLK